MDDHDHELMKSLNKNHGHSGPLPSWGRHYFCHIGGNSDLTRIQAINILTNVEMYTYIKISGFTYIF